MEFAGFGLGGIIVLVVIAILLANSGARRTRNAPLAGVCGGLARHFGVGEGLFRFIAIIMLLCSFGSALLIYIILALALPKD
ncbi:MAG: PspC domain-containing protein [Candidatus Obscuribacterales bacterium]|nr:PspC domain-containing protein [Candidatus Obscuribacterales bacterium]